MPSFQTWLDSYGGTRKLADKLGVTLHAVRYWKDQKGSPRYETALEIVRLSKGALDLEKLLASTAKTKPHRKTNKKKKR